MPQEVLTVTAVSTPNSWVLGAGASKQVAVQSNDGNTSYVRSTAVINTAQQFDITTPSAITGVDLINFVRIEASCIRGASGSGYTYKVSVVRNGTTDGAGKTAGGSYVTTSDDFTTRPAGGAWTHTDLQNLEIKITNTAAKEIRCSYMRVIVDYTVPPPPATPDSLVATAISTTEIDLTWNDNATDETSQEVERSPDGTTNWAQIATPAVNAESYSDTGLTPGTPYFYRVRAVNITGPGAYSNVATDTTDPAVVVTRGIVFNGSTQNAKVTLPDASPYTALGAFQFIFRARDVSFVASQDFLLTIGDPADAPFLRMYAISSTTLAFTDDRDADTKFITPSSMADSVYKVQYDPVNSRWTFETWNSDGSGYVFNTLSIPTTSDWDFGGLRLALGATIFDTRQMACKFDYFRWIQRVDSLHADNMPSANAPGGVTYLAQYEFEDNGNDTSATAGNLTLVGTPTYENSPAQTGGGGGTEFPAPTDLDLTPDPDTGTEIVLDWVDNTTNEDNFEIWRSTPDSNNFVLINTIAADSITYEDTGLSRGTHYYYKVRAKQIDGPVYSSFSTIADVTTPLLAPNAPSNLTASNGSGNTINLAWTDNSEDETGFKIERKLGVSGTYSEIHTTAANVTQYSDTDGAVIGNRPYIYRVRSSKATGDSAYTNEACAVTPYTGTLNNYKTDTATYSESPTTMPLPLKGGKWYDETFGTKIMRFTDESDGLDFGTTYSYWATANEDNTKLWIFSFRLNAYYIGTLDPTTFTRVGSLVAVADSPAVLFTDYESATWSRLDPDKIYILIDAKLYYYKPSTSTFTLVKSLTSSFPAGYYFLQMTVDQYDKRFAFTLKDSGGDQGYAVYDRITDTIVTDVRTVDVNEVHIDKSGRYLRHIPYTDTNQYVIDLETLGSTALVQGSPDYQPGHGDHGYDMVFGNDAFRGGFTARKLSTPHDNWLAFQYSPYWINNHGSSLQNDDNWALISTYGYTGVSADPFKYNREAFQIGVQGPVIGQLRRLFHIRGNWSARGANAIIGATNASPIQITTIYPHGLYTGQQVTISSVGGNTAANGSNRTVTVTGSTTFTIDGSTGNGAYTSGGVTAFTFATTISGASNTTPIEITTPTGHGLFTGQLVQIFSVGGNTAANGNNRSITVTGANTFTIDGSVGNGAYTSGGGFYVEMYWDSPRANISRDGRFVFFTSNWNGQYGGARRDLYIAEIIPTLIVTLPRATEKLIAIGM